MSDKKEKMSKEEKQAKKAEKKRLKQEEKMIKKATKKKLDKMQIATKIVASLMAIIMILAVGTTVIYYVLRMMR